MPELYSIKLWNYENCMRAILKFINFVFGADFDFRSVFFWRSRHIVSRVAANNNYLPAFDTFDYITCQHAMDFSELINYWWSYERVLCTLELAHCTTLTLMTNLFIFICIRRGRLKCYYRKVQCTTTLNILWLFKFTANGVDVSVSSLRFVCNSK